MNLNNIFNGSYQLAMLWKGIEVKVWESSTYNDILHVWDKEGWTDPETLEYIKLMSDFIQYEYKMMIKQLNVIEAGDPTCWRMETDPGDYILLRSGLKSYADMHIRHMFDTAFENILGDVPDEAMILDYCGGEGQYCDYILDLLPHSMAVVHDRVFPSTESNGLHMRVKADFEKNPDWHKGWASKFDVVMLNEILHCKDHELRKYLLESAYQLLKPGGFLIIIDQEYSTHFEVRMNQLTGAGKCFTSNNLNATINNSVLSNKIEYIFSDTNNIQHYIAIWRKL